MTVIETAIGWRNSLGMPMLPLPESGTLLSAWPVRRMDFAAFASAAGYSAKGGMFTIGRDDIDWCDHGHTWENPGFAQGEEHPVVGVSYEDALAFCAWLTARENCQGEKYRLPLDLEWSLAIGLREAPGASPEERLRDQPGVYPWGNAWPPPDGFGNYAGEESREGMPSWWGVAPGGYRDPFPRTSPVGSFPPNSLGFCDLSGNVWEWCMDAYCPGSLSRIVRGGSWGSDRPAYLQSGQRHVKFPDSRSDEIGFRVALARD
jgi:formylglycine-generating enzyme required for sulfatase activity